MIDLKSDGEYKVTGHGTVFTFNSNLPADIPERLQNQLVLIDGKLFRVRGVECFAIMRGPNQPYPQNLGYGILVGDVDDEWLKARWEHE